MVETIAAKPVKKKRPLWQKLLAVPVALLLLLALAVLVMNLLTLAQGRHIVSPAEAARLEADCILVLGAAVYADNTPTPMLADRLDCALALYQAGTAPKIIVSGDHGQQNYDEVGVMKAYLVERGVPSADVFMDHAGFSTYESMYRAQHIFTAERIVVATQRYHLYRALYIGRQLGVETWGVAADTRYYAGQLLREAREIAARCKDVLQCLIMPPALDGEVIPVTGDGDITND